MLRNVARMVGAASVAALCLWSGSARAQDSVLVEMYGAGVHSFYAGNYPQAIADLTGAVQGNSKDPRVFYFRAIAELRLGQNPAAEADMKRGAALESADVNQFYPVSKSLERVQGSNRLMLERYRSKARAEALVRNEQRNAARYEQRTRSEAGVLRQPPAAGPPVPVPPPTPPARPAGPADVAAESEDLFGDAAGKESEEMPAKAPAAAPTDPDDPFAEAPAKTPAAKPADAEDPFAAGGDDKDAAMAPDDAADEKATDEADADEMPADGEKPAKKAAAADEEEDADMAGDDEKPVKKAAADKDEDEVMSEKDEKPAKKKKPADDDDEVMAGDDEKPAKKAAADKDDDEAMSDEDEKPAKKAAADKDDDEAMSDEDEKPAKKPAKKKKPAEDDEAMNQKVPTGGAEASKLLDTSDPFVDDPAEPTDMNAGRATGKKF